MNEASGGRFSGVQYYIFLKRTDILEKNGVGNSNRGVEGLLKLCDEALFTVIRSAAQET